MFQELHALANSSPIAMLIAGEGEQLRVTVTQKAGKKGVPINLSIVATPAELDAELPGAIVQASAELATAAPIAEQVRAQVDSAKSAAPKKARTKAAKKTKPPKPVKAKKPATAPNSKPQRMAPPPKAKTKAARQPEHTREACVEDLVKLITEHGAGKVNREFFIEHGTTARSFERHFGGWKKFIAAGRKRVVTDIVAEDTAPPTIPKEDNLQLPLEAAPEEPPLPIIAEPPPEPASAAPLPSDWPFPTTPKDVELGEPKADDSHGRDVYDEQGNYLSSITTRPGIGGLIHLVSQPTPLEVVSIDGRRIITRPKPRPKLRDVVLEDGTVIAQDLRELEPGDVVTVHNIRHTVVRADAERIVVQAPAAPQPKVRKVIDDEGANVGQFTGDDLSEGETITVGDKSFTVMGFNEKAIFVEPADATEGA